MLKFDKDSQIIVFTHRPLFPLYPQWEWWTQDGQKALDLLAPFNNVTVFYGHIHQNNQAITGKIKHYAAPGLMYPLPAPGSVPKRAPVPWDPEDPYKGLGFRTVEVNTLKPGNIIKEYTITAMQSDQVIKISAKKFEFSPNEVHLKKGVPVILELTSLDRLHGIFCQELNINAKIEPGKITRVKLVPSKTGTFDFHCSVYCGEGHDDITGKFIVEE